MKQANCTLEGREAAAEASQPDHGESAEDGQHGRDGDACRASLEDFLQSVAPDGVNMSGDGLKDTSALRWASRPDVNIYTLKNESATHFERPGPGGPDWNSVVARVTVDQDSNTVLEDADIEYHNAEHWVREIPSSPRSVEITFYFTVPVPPPDKDEGGEQEPKDNADRHSPAAYQVDSLGAHTPSRSAASEW